MASETKWTEGPWEAEPKQARGHWLKGPDGDYIAMVCRRENEAEEDANAALVGAVHALYEALKGLADKTYPDNGGPIDKALRNARAALSKAKAP